MKLLIDCSSLQVGGGIQVASSFLNDLNNGIPNEVDYHIILSPQINEQIDKSIFKKNFQFYILEKKYYKNFIKRGNELKKLENQIMPDVNFTVFGPSYYKSSVPKIVGYAIPHYIYTDSPFFKQISLKEKLKLFIEKNLKLYFFKKNSDYLVFETKDALSRFATKYNFNASKCFVAHNTLNEIFTKPNNWNDIKLNIKGDIKILCLTSNYKHKNISIIPKIIDELIEGNKTQNFKFVITLQKQETNFEEKYNQFIEYVGKVNHNNLPSLYNQIDIVFISSLLEVFSATYLEAMFMKKPIVTTNLSFAKDICQEAALYYSAIDFKDATNKIEEVIYNNQLKEDLIQKGLENLKRFGSSLDRTNTYLNIINKAYEERYKR